MTAPRDSTILTGVPEIPFYDAAEFNAFVERIIGGGAITRADAARCTKKQWQKLRAAVFLDALKHCNAVFESGQHRGRRGAAMVLQVCQNALEVYVPEAAENLHVLQKLIGALGECNTGELPLLFQPGVDAEDHKAHLSIVPKDDNDGE